MPKDDAILQALTNLNDKMDRHNESVNARLTSIEKTQVKQEENLGEHMRRTELAEKGIDILASELKTIKKDEIEPLKKFKSFIEGGLKGIGLVFTVVSFVAGIIKIISFFQP